MAIGRYTQGLNMGKEEWDAINKIREELSFMRGRLSILIPILLMSGASFLASLGALVIALMTK